MCTTFICVNSFPDVQDVPQPTVYTWQGTAVMMQNNSCSAAA
jgi:hypothetical protein